MKERLLDGRQRKIKIQSSGKMRQSICERIKTHSSLAGNQLLIVRYGRGRGGEGETRETWPETENTQHVPRPNSLSLKVLLVAQSS